MRGIEPAYLVLADQTTLSEPDRKSIYRGMRGGEKWKYTYPQRHLELDRWTEGHLERHFSPGSRLRIHDLGASNAITSVELFHRFAQRWSVTMKASDFYDVLQHVRLFGTDYLFDAVGTPLQASIGSKGISIERGPLRHLIKPFWPLARRRLSTARRISLFHPEAQELAAANPSFTLAREDYFQPEPGEYDFIRMACALDPRATTDAQAKAAVKAVAKTLVDDGVLVVANIQGASLFVRRGSRLEEIDRFSGGNLWATAIMAIDIEA